MSLSVGGFLRSDLVTLDHFQNLPHTLLSGQDPETSHRDLKAQDFDLRQPPAHSSARWWWGLGLSVSHA